MSAPRLVDVAPERLEGWVGRFADSHGEVSWSIDRETSSAFSSWLGRAADGSWARLTGWADADEGQGWPALAAVPSLLVILLRRGGYAVACAGADGTLASHKVGTRHVQSRTAAGGWSQQRYARRRSNQADALVEAVVGHAARVLEEGERAAGRVGGLVVGGDRTLAAEVTDELATGPLERLHSIPRRELWDLPDPRRAVLEDAVRRGRSVKVEVANA